MDDFHTLLRGPAGPGTCCEKHMLSLEFVFGHDSLIVISGPPGVYTQI